MAKKTFIRITTRGEPEQIKFIKSYAKKHKLTEGEVYRSIINFFIENNGK